MSDNPLAEFLPKKEEKADEALDLIDRANLQFSLLDILNREFGYSIPYDGAGSVKQRCIWGWEHKDGGAERCMRYYWESDRAFCFRDHGVIDVVTIRASQKGISKVKTAKLLLQEAGLLKADPWDVRIEKIQDKLSERPSQQVNLRLAEQAFNQQLRNIDGYGKVQFKPTVVQAKIELMEELDPRWGLESLSTWLENAKKRMRNIVSEEGSR